MKKKNFASYKEVCDQLKFIAEKYNLILSPKFGHTDFEHAIRKALKHRFPQIKLRGFYFHFKQTFGLSLALYVTTNTSGIKRIRCPWIFLESIYNPIISQFRKKKKLFINFILYNLILYHYSLDRIIIEQTISS